MGLSARAARRTPRAYRSESLVALEQRLAERLLDFERLDEAWPRGCTAIERAKEFAPAGPGQLHVAVPKDLARAILAEVDALPEDLAGAVWLGFLRGQVAQAGSEPAHIHHGGNA